MVHSRGGGRAERENVNHQLDLHQPDAAAEAHESHRRSQPSTHERRWTAAVPPPCYL